MFVLPRNHFFLNEDKRRGMVDRQDWKALDTLYETANITQAAAKLFISQPSLTARIKRLEQRFNVPIIIRKRRGVLFTPEGKELVQYAKRMLKDEQALIEKIKNMRDEVAGTIRVGVSNFFALNKMPKILRLFKKRYPKVEFQVVTGWSSEMHRHLVNDDVHISFIKGNYPWKGIKEVLYEEEICVAAPWVFEWGELPELPRVDYLTDALMKGLVDDWWYRNYDQKPYINIEVNQVETCKEMVVNGLGYAILANLVVQTHPDLFIKPIQDEKGNLITRKTSMYYHRDVLNLNAVNAFITFIRELEVKKL